MTGGLHQATDLGSLAELRDDFPSYRIWQEITGIRVRYVARRIGPGPGLHTLVTADLEEMRGILPQPPAGRPPSVPSR